MREEENNEAEAVEREQCIELMRAALKIDPNGRITPREVLAHLFIAIDYLKCVHVCFSMTVYNLISVVFPRHQHDSECVIWYGVCACARHQEAQASLLQLRTLNVSLLPLD